MKMENEREKRSCKDTVRKGIYHREIKSNGASAWWAWEEVTQDETEVTDDNHITQTR